VKEPATHSKQKDPLNSITTPDSEYGEGTGYTGKEHMATQHTTHTDSHPPGNKTGKNGNTITPGA